MTNGLSGMGKKEKTLEAIRNKDIQAIGEILEGMRLSALTLAYDKELDDPKNVVDEAIAKAKKVAFSDKLSSIPNPHPYLKKVIRNFIIDKAPTTKDIEEHKPLPPASGRDYLRPGEDLRTLLASVIGDISSSKDSRGKLGYREYQRDDAAKPGEAWVEGERLSKEYPDLPYIKFLRGAVYRRDESLDRGYREVIAQVNSIASETAKQRMVKYLQGYSLSDIAKEEPPNPETGKAISKQAIYNSIKKYLEAWGWDEERVKEIRYSWLFATLVDIEKNVSPRPPYSEHGYTSPSTISTKDLKDPSFVNQLYRYYNQFHQQIITDPRTKAWNFPESSIEWISGLIGISTS